MKPIRRGRADMGGGGGALTPVNTRAVQAAHCFALSLCAAPVVSVRASAPGPHTTRALPPVMASQGSPSDPMIGGGGVMQGKTMQKKKSN